MDSTLVAKQTSWGQRFPEITEAAIRNFASNIGDTNPLHHDNGAAQKMGLPGIIAPGVMTIGFVSSAIAEAMPGTQVRRLGMKFVNPLYAGSLPSVFCDMTHRSGRVMKIIVAIKDGERVVAIGDCVLLLPLEKTS